MKKVYFKKLLTFALAICLTFTSAFVFSPQASIQVHAVGNINNPTPLQPNSNIDFSSGWTNIPHKDHHCYKVILQSGAARTEAHRFYEHIGFNGTSKKAFDMRLE